MKNKLVVMIFVIIFFGGASASDVANDTEKQSVSKKSLGGLNSRATLDNQTNLLKSQLRQLQYKNMIDSSEQTKTNKYFYTLAEMYAHGPAVVVSPGFGLRISDEEDVPPELVVRLSKINRDLLILKLRKKIDNYAIANDISIPRSPLIVLSGGVEGRLVYNNNDNYTQTSKTDINLSRAELDVIGEICPWVTTAMIVSYDDKYGSGSNITRANNSRLQIDRGWLTVGQLNKFPFYFTLGQVYAPFGSYSRFGVTNISTQKLGRMKDRMAILGFDYNGINGQVYIFAGETQSLADESKITKITKHGGLNLGYKYETNNFGIRVGGGVIGNLAESESMQEKIFGKLKNSSASEALRSRVLGYNGYVKFGIYNFDLLAEFVTASKAFDPTEISFNNSGAKPKALNIECAYNFDIKSKTSTVFTGFSVTSQSLAINLPKQSFITGYSIALIKNTLASIEYRHDIDYAWTDSATCAGKGKISVTRGRHKNTVTLQVGAYF